MNTINAVSSIEQYAAEATKLSPFGINLPEVKRTIAEMLSQIGKFGFFEQYSKHDISHIDEMLNIAEWLIDERSRPAMTQADFLLVALGIYFHDLGMLVTQDEFENRGRSSFPEFCREKIFDDKDAQDYRAKIETLSPDDAQKFMYQEFVRHYHAKRVRNWIEGKADDGLGSCAQQIAEVQRVINGLDYTVKRDLALIAESHHLDDLNDLKKYKPDQHYGPSSEERSNIQYCAIILRAADLLHMRNDRTPSVLFRLINPTDPISQREWAKQNAIRAVSARLGVNQDGLPDDKAARDTIEIHAYFRDEGGFFGLTSFLGYVQKEIKKCHAWSEECRKLSGTKHNFGWKYIAEDKIETEGFLPDTFRFDIDQYKILDLLIGHTLYNDTSVVLRELVQNSFDAIRLQAIAQPSSAPGEVKIRWNSQERTLLVSDNGTGMTQSVIQEHLLKVGSSKYQDQKFKEQFPTFSPISRFGIGVLSAFMVADAVDIVTCCPEEQEARKIALRSVHGRYLIRLLDKSCDELKELMPHGTRFILKLRPTAKLADVITLARQWVVLPGCKVTVTVDDGPEVEVGYRTAGEAVDAFLKSRKKGDNEKYRVIEKEREGVSLAYAVRWTEYFKDWSIARFSIDRKDTPIPVPCTCIEGVAVEFTTPGFRTANVAAVVNATGSKAPKTNVARSNLEATEERNELIATIYELFSEHVRDEINRLVTVEGYSLTWAVSNALTLISALTLDEGRGGAILPDRMKCSLRGLPVFIVESAGQRNNIPLETLISYGKFWVIDCELVRSAETLIKEVSSNAAVGTVLQALGDSNINFPSGYVLSNFASGWFVGEAIEANFEPVKLVAYSDLRRTDVEWIAKEKASRWLRVADISQKDLNTSKSRGSFPELRGRLDQMFNRSGYQVGNIYPERLWISASEDVNFECDEQYAGLTSNSLTFIRQNTMIAQYLIELSKNTDDADGYNIFLVSTYLALASLSRSQQGKGAPLIEMFIKRLSVEFGDEMFSNKNDLVAAIVGSPFEIFDTSVWSRRILNSVPS